MRQTAKPTVKGVMKPRLAIAGTKKRGALQQPTVSRHRTANARDAEAEWRELCTNVQQSAAVSSSAECTAAVELSKCRCVEGSGSNSTAAVPRTAAQQHSTTAASVSAVWQQSAPVAALAQEPSSALSLLSLAPSA